MKELKENELKYVNGGALHCVVQGEVIGTAYQQGNQWTLTTSSGGCITVSDEVFQEEYAWMYE